MEPSWESLFVEAAQRRERFKREWVDVKRLASDQQEDHPGWLASLLLIEDVASGLTDGSRDDGEGGRAGSEAETMKLKERLEMNLEAGASMAGHTFCLTLSNDDARAVLALYKAAKRAHAAALSRGIDDPEAVAGILGPAIADFEKVQ